MSHSEGWARGDEVGGRGIKRHLMGACSLASQWPGIGHLSYLDELLSVSPLRTGGRWLWDLSEEVDKGTGGPHDAQHWALTSLEDTVPPQDL